MKLDPFTFSDESKSKSRRKKEQAAKKIDAAIKVALVELADFKERRDAFLRLLACVRARTLLLKPTHGQGNPGWVGPVFLINRLKNLAIRQHHWIRPCETWQWSEWQDFHLRPPGPKPGALKTELHSEKMADPKGIAPSTLPQRESFR